MAPSSLFAVATLALSIFGANAGPCRPTTTVTSLAETTSTAVVETSSTTLVETTTSLAESSSTTLAQTSTTSQAPDCDTTQVLINPSFDDDNGAPWEGIGNIRSDQDPRSGSHNLRFRFTGGGVERYTFSQSLTNLNGPYRLSYYYHLVGWVGWESSQGFGCSIVPTVGSRRLPSSGPSPDGPYQWTQENLVWSNTSPSGHVDQATVSFSVSCAGEFNELTLAIDDVTFTEIKCEPMQT